MLEYAASSEKRPGLKVRSKGARLMVYPARIAPPDTSTIGAKVSIRIHDQEPGKFRDLLGHLVDLTHVRDKNGVIKEFNPEKIVAWKVVSK